jgi:CheY-like chemotaxis protein
MAAGMDCYISKPVQEEELRTALARGIAKTIKPSAQPVLA